MSLFSSIYIDLSIKDKKLHLKNKDNKDNKIVKPENVNNDKGIITKLEEKVDEVFIKMERRGSYTNFRIDYPWLTI